MPHVNDDGGRNKYIAKPSATGEVPLAHVPIFVILTEPPLRYSCQSVEPQVKGWAGANSSTGWFKLVDMGLRYWLAVDGPQ